MTSTGLPGGLRERLERSFGADLRAVRVHTGPTADRLARRLRADAFTCSADIFFRNGAYRPDTVAGRRLIAHEAAHVVQQSRGTVGGVPVGPWRVSTPGDAGEREADRYAEAALAGRVADPAAPPVTVRRRRASRVIQRHVSFEHRLLGDVVTDDLVAIAIKGARRNVVLKNQIELMALWANEPEKVTETQVNAVMPSARTLRLGPDRVLATYGEVNALPDYLANPDALDTLPQSILLPVLQVIRQEGYNQLTELLTGEDPVKMFPRAACAPWKLSLVNTIVETVGLDQLTMGLGKEGQDHYQGLLGRNACHFAPFSWYRWQTAHLMARSLAEQAYQKNKDPELTRLAWVYHGYADHFLQDSFAAGHLVNKTLIMQWFIEWAAKQNLLPIADWDAIKDMTAGRQPNLAGRPLYKPEYMGPSNDPQTVQEAETLVARVLGSGVIADGPTDRDTAYQNYLTFLTGAAAQLASGNLHDYYNAHSLWVASPEETTPYQIWGDDTLLTGSNGTNVWPGVTATSEAAQLSQEALRQILNNGETSITIGKIRVKFPTKAGNSSTTVQDLETWNDSQRAFCDESFGGFTQTLKNLLSNLASPRLGVVSQDQRFASVWSASLPGSGFFPAEMVHSAGRLFAGSYGWAYELDPVSGKVLHSLQLRSSGGMGDYETRVATDGTMLFVGVHGYVYGIALDDWSAPKWTVGVGEKGYNRASILSAGGRLFVGSNGYVYELDPKSGAVKNKLLVTSDILFGDYDTRLDTDGQVLFVGAHGSAYGVKLDDWSRNAWSAVLPGPATSWPVTVLAANGKLYAGCSGYVYELDPGTGKQLHQLLLTTMGSAGYEARLATDGRRLFAGVHGFAYGVALDKWTTDSTWSVGVGGEGFQPVSVLVFGDRLYAGSNGYAHQLDPSTGAKLYQLLLTYLFSVGNFDTRLATDGQHLFTGVHGYLTKILTGDARLAHTIYHQRQREVSWLSEWTPNFDQAPYQVRQVTGAMGPGGSLEMFVVDEDGVLYHDSQAPNGTWNGKWEANFGKIPLVRSVSAMLGSTGNLEVFAAGADGVLYHNCLSPSGLQPAWTPNFDNAPPGIVSVAGAMGPTGNLEVFAIDADGVLYHNCLNPKTGWQGKWVPNFCSAPPVESVIAVMGPTNYLEVFAVGVDRVLYHNSLNAYSGWQPTWMPDFDGAPKAQAVAAAKGPGDNLHVFAVGVDGVLFHDMLTPQGHWQGSWTPKFDSAPPVQSVVPMMGPTGYLHVFAVGTDELLYHNSANPDGGWQGVWVPNFLFAPASRAVATARGPGGSLEVFAISAQ